MIVGAFIKGFKTYQSLNFISFLKSKTHKLSIFIGQNGAGKSSILEALDYFFNGAQWIKNINSKTGEGFVCPVFLVKKKDLSRFKAAPYVSDYFWKYSVPETAGAANYYAWELFCEFRDEVLSDIDRNEYYLLVAGLDEFGETSYTSTHEKIKNSFRPKGVSFADHDRLVEQIKRRYSYIYLPIHNSPAGLVDLKARELQGIMDKNLLTEINSILGAREKTGSVDRINSKLDNFISTINSGLSQLGGSYEYKSQQSAKLTESDISEVILKKYFASRPLQKDGKPIESLSSGEQRMAIIDVAYSFLSQNKNTNKDLILAIDEPESSLNAMNCMLQFKRLLSIANDYNKQCLISTHWYGLLMSPEPATLSHISKDHEDKPTAKSFDLSYIQESRREFPDDLEMKSYFDLVSSILSIMKHSSKGWIICEGTSDKIYLEKIITASGLNILPVGGSANVIKVYEYLRVAMEDKGEQSMIKGKIICLIDSDIKIRTIEKASQKTSRNLAIKRFQSTNSSVTLVNATRDGDYSHTEIEDALYATDYYNAMKKTVSKLGDSSIQDIFSNGYDFDEDFIEEHAKVSQSLPFLKLKDLQYQKKKRFLIDFINRGDIKDNIARNYEHNSKTPSWAIDIVAFLEPVQG